LAAGPGPRRAPAAMGCRRVQVRRQERCWLRQAPAPVASSPGWRQARRATGPARSWACAAGRRDGGTGTSFCDETGAPDWPRRGVLPARASASLRFSSSLRAWYCSHLALRSSAGQRLTSAKFRRAWVRCWLLRAAHSIMRLCRVACSSADMLAKLRTAPATCAFARRSAWSSAGPGACRACCWSAVSSLQSGLVVGTALGLRWPRTLRAGLPAAVASEAAARASVRPKAATASAPAQTMRPP
jgi:hypothetical protein